MKFMLFGDPVCGCLPTAMSQFLGAVAEAVFPEFSARNPRPLETA